MSYIEELDENREGHAPTDTYLFTRWLELWTLSFPDGVAAGGLFSEMRARKHPDI